MQNVDKFLERESAKKGFPKSGKEKAQMQNVKIFEMRESAKKGFPKSSKCECNCCYTHLSSFRHFRLAECCAKRARETFGFSTRLA